MTTDDTIGMIHVVLIRSDKGIEVREFTGEKAHIEAHQFATRIAIHQDALVTVCVRVRELGSLQSIGRFSASE